VGVVVVVVVPSAQAACVSEPSATKVTATPPRALTSLPRASSPLKTTSAVTVSGRGGRGKGRSGGSLLAWAGTRTMGNVTVPAPEEVEAGTRTTTMGSTSGQCRTLRV